MGLYKHVSYQEVPFFDCDPMGVVWHGNYLKYMEIARGEVLDELGYPYARIGEEGYAFPIVDIRVKYVESLFLKEKFEVVTDLIEYENRLVHNFVIKKDDRICCKARSVQVCVHSDNGEMDFFMPENFRKTVEKLLRGPHEV